MKRAFQIRTRRWILPLPYFRGVVAVPGVVSRFPRFDFPRAPKDPVAVDYRTGLWGSAAFGVVYFAEGKLKISVGRFFCDVADTI